MKKLLLSGLTLIICSGVMSNCVPLVYTGLPQIPIRRVSPIATIQIPVRVKVNDSTYCTIWVGPIYESTKIPGAPIAYYGPAGSTDLKVAKVTFTNILGLIVTGDASLETAMRKAGIQKVHHITQEVNNILGLWSTYTLYVYGE